MSKKARFWRSVKKGRVPGVAPPDKRSRTGRNSQGIEANINARLQPKALGRRVRKFPKSQSKPTIGRSNVNNAVPSRRSLPGARKGLTDAGRAALERKKEIQAKREEIQKLEADESVPFPKKRKTIKILKTELRNPVYKQRKELTRSYGRVLSLANTNDKKGALKEAVSGLLSRVLACLAPDTNVSSSSSSSPDDDMSTCPLGPLGSHMSRCLQACLKYGSQEERNKTINIILTDKSLYGEMVKGKYSHVVVCKMFLYCEKQKRESMIDELIEDPELPILSRYCSTIVNYIYNNFCNNKQKRYILNRMFLNEKSAANWKELFNEMNAETLNNKTLEILNIVDKLVDRELLRLDVVMVGLNRLTSVFSEILSLRPDVSECASELLKGVSERINEGAHTCLVNREGVNLLKSCIGLWDAKMKKRFIKNINETAKLSRTTGWTDYACNQLDYEVILRLIDTVDDSVILIKSVLKPMIGRSISGAGGVVAIHNPLQLQRLLASPSACRCLLRILAPNNNKYFLTQDLQARQLLTTQTHKDVQTKLTELRDSFLVPILLDFVKNMLTSPEEELAENGEDLPSEEEDDDDDVDVTHHHHCTSPSCCSSEHEDEDEEEEVVSPPQKKRSKGERHVHFADEATPPEEEAVPSPPTDNNSTQEDEFRLTSAPSTKQPQPESKPFSDFLDVAMCKSAKDVLIELFNVANSQETRALKLDILNHLIAAVHDQSEWEAVFGNIDIQKFVGGLFSTDKTVFEHLWRVVLKPHIKLLLPSKCAHLYLRALRLKDVLDTSVYDKMSQLIKKQLSVVRKLTIERDASVSSALDAISKALGG